MEIDFSSETYSEKPQTIPPPTAQKSNLVPLQRNTRTLRCFQDINSKLKLKDNQYFVNPRKWKMEKGKETEKQEGSKP
ncbi:hypothetical protein LguiA_027103 [Lonicera macranthoides]